MIIENQEQVTAAVLQGVQGAQDPRLREILTSLVAHLHGFARDVRLTEREFERAIGYIARSASARRRRITRRS